jgi:hypothetical protein
VRCGGIKGRSWETGDWGDWAAGLGAWSAHLWSVHLKCLNRGRRRMQNGNALLRGRWRVHFR